MKDKEDGNQKFQDNLSKMSVKEKIEMFDKKNEVVTQKQVSNISNALGLSPNIESDLSGNQKNQQALLYNGLRNQNELNQHIVQDEQANQGVNLAPMILSFLSKPLDFVTKPLLGDKDINSKAMFSIDAKENDFTKASDNKISNHQFSIKTNEEQKQNKKTNKLPPSRGEAAGAIFGMALVYGGVATAFVFPPAGVALVVVGYATYGVSAANYTKREKQEADLNKNNNPAPKNSTEKNKEIDGKSNAQEKQKQKEVEVKKETKNVTVSDKVSNLGKLTLDKQKQEQQKENREQKGIKVETTKIIDKPVTKTDLNNKEFKANEKVKITTEKALDGKEKIKSAEPMKSALFGDAPKINQKDMPARIVEQEKKELVNNGIENMLGKEGAYELKNIIGDLGKDGSVISVAKDSKVYQPSSPSNPSSSNEKGNDKAPKGLGI